MISDTRTPESVLKGKQHYYDAIQERFGRETADAVFSDALARISEYWYTHDRLPEGQAIHVEDNIVPIAFDPCCEVGCFCHRFGSAENKNTA